MDKYYNSEFRKTKTCRGGRVNLVNFVLKNLNKNAK